MFELVGYRVNKVGKAVLEFMSDGVIRTKLEGVVVGSWRWDATLQAVRWKWSQNQSFWIEGASEAYVAAIARSVVL